MHINRYLFKIIEKKLNNAPVVALLGPRQCGKSTIAKRIVKKYKNSVYLDLEKIIDRNKLNDIWLFFSTHRNQLICLDEIQLMPEIFSQIRSFVDEQNTNAQFLILGSASRDLIKQSSQTLAGRISFLEMSPFSLTEVTHNVTHSIIDLWLKGGFPRSFLNSDNEESLSWRDNYILTFLERDLPQLGFRVPSQTLNRFWTMSAHNHGQILNASKFGTSLGVSSNTIKHYIHILEETFMIRLLQPYFTNLKKRLIKSPKMYIRDSGIVHALLQIETIDQLLGHPVYGFSFEGFVIENLVKKYPFHQPYYFRSAKGEEIDLLLIRGKEIIAYEIKASSSPHVDQGFWSAVKFVKATKICIIAQVEHSYAYSEKVIVKNILEECLD